jgi:hypothetical protein
VHGLLARRESEHLLAVGRILGFHFSAGHVQGLRGGRKLGGDPAFGLYRACAVVATRMDISISWARYRAFDPTGGAGLLVDDELTRAIRSSTREVVTNCLKHQER